MIVVKTGIFPLAWNPPRILFGVLRMIAALRNLCQNYSGVRKFSVNLRAPLPALIGNFFGYNSIFCMDVQLNENKDRVSSGFEELRITITAEEINNLPLRTFSGKTSVVSDPQQLSKIVKEIEYHDVVGFDTETRPSFKKGQVFQVSLLQLAIPKKVYLIRLNHTGVTEELASLFSNADIIKTGVGIRDDLRALQRLRTFEPIGFHDLSTLAKEAGLQVESVKKLTALLLGFRISKSAQTSNWEVPTFTQKQIEYAATDAWVCLELYHKLKPKNNSVVS